MIGKLRDCFDEMVVYKDLKKSNFFSALSLPSFLRDWLLKKFEDENGDFDLQEVSEFIQTYIPKKEDWMYIKNRIIYEGEHVKLLTKISVDINIKNQEITFSLPDFGLTNKETIIEPYVWETCKDDLVKGKETWGVIELGYRYPDEVMKLPGKIKLIGFTDFCPYTVDLEYYKDVRVEFTVEEWIDVILGAIDYNASGYSEGEEGQCEKLAMLQRLLPFVEKRLNLIELAPKGTGKSYLFGHVSKYGLLTDGGKVTRAKMFYDASKNMPGFIMGNDFVAIDEVKLVTFGDVNEMRSIMQGYMEYGTFNFGGYNGQSDAGIVFLGNIDVDNMDEYENMFVELPSLFQESALVDRIHGFIKGWEIPRMNDDLKVCGWALNSEYFSSILHLLREDASYRAIVDQLIIVPEKADTRDTEAVKRISTAYLKLLFPNVRKVTDITSRDFFRYCLRPAKRMRKIIKIQLGILDKEFKGKDIPDFKVRRIDEKY
jgi:ATP-dependent Lon protease